MKPLRLMLTTETNPYNLLFGYFMTLLIKRKLRKFNDKITKLVKLKEKNNYDKNKSNLRLLV